jgi:hypothetical protein
LHVLALSIDAVPALPKNVRLHSAVAWFLKTDDPAT